jgi:glycosyltransferase involved in cell wall biosynthesis
VALSPTHRVTLSSVGIAVTHVLPLPVTPTNGYLEAYEAHIQQNRPPTVIGFAGELSRLKGADAIPSILQALTPDFAFHVVGSGPLSRLLTWSMRNLSPLQQASIVLSGPAKPSEMPRFYREIDCLLVLSQTESQCRVALEAMLGGVIVLARATSGVSDLVVDGVTGLFVDQSDPESLRDRLAWLAASPAEAQAIRIRARALAERSFRSSHARWHAFFSELVDLRRNAQ